MGKNADTPYGTMSVPLDNTTLDTEVAALKTGVGFALPTVDPAVAGELWSNAGVVTVSAG